MAERKTNIIRVTVGVVVAALALGLLFIATRQDRNRGQMPDAANLRHIVQAMSLYANEHDKRFPGVPKEANAPVASVQRRYQTLLDQQYLEARRLISSIEEDTKTHWQNEAENGPLTADHYSYAMLQVPESGGRREEWSFRPTPEAALISDRNLGTAAQPRSLWNADAWEGYVAWGDGHSTFELDPDLNTQYGDTNHQNDHLFRSTGVDDALMVYTGN
jgi:hypothetical protein